LFLPYCFCHIGFDRLLPGLAEYSGLPSEAEMILILIGIFLIFFFGLICGIRLANWAIKNRRMGISRVHKME